MTLRELFERFAQLGQFPEGTNEKVALIRRYPALASLGFREVLRKGFGSWDAEEIEQRIVKVLEEEARAQNKILALLESRKQQGGDDPPPTVVQ